MREELLALERTWLRGLVAFAIIAVIGVAAAYGVLKYMAVRQAALLPPAEPPVIGATLQENTCASTRCHPALAEAPATSRHANVACVSCHSQRRSHNADCVICHDQIRQHSTETISVELAKEEMARVRRDMEQRHEQALADQDSEAAKAFPEPIPCVTCHLKLYARPVTFPTIELAEHLPEGKTSGDCTDCHRAHDPKPVLGHPIPTADCRRGRGCCLACHLGEDQVAGVERVGAAGSVETQAGITDLSWASPEFQAWAHDEFGDELLTPPRVPVDHGHGTVECIACHGEPPTFQALASRVHDFEHESVRCGKCHTGATIIDQQVMLEREQAEDDAAGGDHGGHDGAH